MLPDIIKESLNWVAPINNIPIKIKSITLIFFNLINKYKALAVINCGNNKNLGPDISCSIVGEEIMNIIIKLIDNFLFTSFFKNVKNKINEEK